MAGIMHGLVIFLGAFLLFQVQPLIAKKILPWFGGTAAVWLACMLFFQVALLGGYVYAHLLATRIPTRARGTIHLFLLAASLLFLPIIPSDAWRPSGGDQPLLHVLAVLAATLGLPYFLLSTATPLVQAWYAERAAASPYKFFAVSNGGSLLGLLSYPLVIEPLLTSRQQAWLWSAAYAVLALLYAALTLRHREARPASATELPEGDTVSLSRSGQSLWLILPAISAALLFAVTNHVTQNIAAVPLLWVVPLSLYLLSFVLCFGSPGFYSRKWFAPWLAVALGSMAYALHPDFANTDLRLLLGVYCGGLFVACLVCHGELARLRPAPARLTRYYLFISLGGALGGLYVSGIAPLVHSGIYELPISIAACAVACAAAMFLDPESRLHSARWIFAWIGVIGLIGVLIGGLATNAVVARGDAKVHVRSFYGVLRVIEDSPGGAPIRKLMHGSIDHGLQFTAPERRRSPASYYVPLSGVGIAVREAQSRGPVRVGIVGLGTGTLAAYARPGDVFRFYEIDPQVIRLARSEFTFLSDAPPDTIQIATGDARLSLQREARQNFDVLAVDAFSGDAIPVHLLTREAIELYFRHLKPGGVVALHISNRYLNLNTVSEAVLRALGKHAVLIEGTADDETGVYRSYWVLASDREEFFENEELRPGRRGLERRDTLRPWTDDYSNLIRVLK